MSNLYRRSSDTIFSPVGKDVVALNVKRGLCYGMEDVTVAVWDLLDEARSIAQLRDELIERYDVDPAVCAREVGVLIEQMQREGLVETVK